MEVLRGYKYDMSIVSELSIIVSANVDNGGNGLSKVYICDDFTKISNTSVNDYIYIGNIARNDGYIKVLIFGENGCILSLSGGGTSTYPIGDGHYIQIPSSGESLRGVMIGGNAYSNVSAGIFFDSYTSTPSGASSYIGTRLCYIKK